MYEVLYKEVMCDCKLEMTELGVLGLERRMLVVLVRFAPIYPIFCAAADGLFGEIDR